MKSAAASSGSSGGRADRQDTHAAFTERLSLGIPTLHLVKRGKVLQVARHGTRLRMRSFLVDSQGAFLERQGEIVSSRGSVENSQIVQVRGYGGVARAEDLLVSLKGALLKGFSFRIPAFDSIDHRQVVQRAGESSVRLTQLLGLFQGAQETLLGFGITSFLKQLDAVRVELFPGGGLGAGWG